MPHASAPKQPQGPILVTGATGFIGAYLVRYLCSTGATVWGVRGTSPKHWRDFSHPKYHAVSLDLTHTAKLQTLLGELQPSVIINCAAYGAYSSQTDADRIYRVNVDVVRHLLEYSKQSTQFRAFIQAGSSSEYGFNCTAPLESDETQPDSHYAASKVAAGALVRMYGLKFKVPAFNLRLYSVYGPFEDFSRLVPKLLLAALKGELPPLVNPRISRDFVYVEDVCEVITSLIERAPRLPAGEMINVGAGKKVTLRELVQVARKTFKISTRPDWGSMQARHWDHPDWYSNSQKARRLLRWKAKTTLNNGLKMTADWITANPTLVSVGIRESVTGAINAR